MKQNILQKSFALLCAALTIIPLPISAENRGETEEVKGDSYMRVTLTSSESKRLIAKGLKLYSPVAGRLNKGELVVAKGTTNHYLYEELTGKTIEKGSFISGNIQPTGNTHKPQIEESLGELYLKDGVDQRLNLDQALPKIESGAIIFKGANMINYTLGQAALLIGHPTGGTAGMILPYIKSGVAKLIIPVGLEKNSSYDLDELAEKFSVKRQGALQVFTLPGELFTEIEAIKQVANVEVVQIAAGGINGAEGAVTLSVRGEKEELAKVRSFLKEIQGEAAFY